ncbi:hypothetical protein CISIN_1g0196082mg, partial [Citrus sinensis]
VHCENVRNRLMSMLFLTEIGLKLFHAPTILLRLLYMLVCWWQVEELISPYGCFLHLWWLTWYLQQQKLRGGIFVNLTITQVTDMQLFHMYISIPA